MKLSEAIRKGHTMIGEGISYMPSRGENLQEAIGCALCAAWLGMGKTVEEYWDKRAKDPNDGGREKTFSDALGISEELVEEISRKHCSGMSREQIADWVEREYESKLPQKVREPDAAYTQRILSEIRAMPQLVEKENVL